MRLYPYLDFIWEWMERINNMNKRKGKKQMNIKKKKKK